MCWPHLQTTTLHCNVCFHLFVIFSSWMVTLEGILGSLCDQTTGFTCSGCEESTKENVHLFSSVAHLSSCACLFAWLAAAELTDCLPRCLAPSLIGLSLAPHSHTARASPRLECGETVGLLRRQEERSLRDFFLPLLWWTVGWEQRKISGSLSSSWPLSITAVLHPWLFIPGWCTGLDLSWFGHFALHRVSRMYVNMKNFAMHGDVNRSCTCMCACARASVDLYVTNKKKWTLMSRMEQNKLVQAKWSRTWYRQ